jgi:hypothetical protein
MNVPDELTGSLVLVHPDLQHDTAGRQGHIGMIIGSNLERDEISLSFGKGEQALYSSDALLVLKTPENIYGDLLSNNKGLDPADFKALFRISLLQQYGDTKSFRTAIELAMKNDILRSHSMISLQDKLGISMNESRARKHD